MNRPSRIVVVKEGRFYVAHDAERDVTSQGLTVDESLASLEEAIALFLQDESEDEASRLRENL